MSNKTCAGFHKPTIPGWYWIKAPNLSPRIDKFAHPGWDKRHCYCPYTGGDILNLHGRPYMYAGPINEPNKEAHQPSRSED
jgi:hypothetical protein